MTQIDNAAPKPSLTVVASAAFTPASTTASLTAEQTFTGQPVTAGDFGICLPPNGAAANSVFPTTWRCTTTGSAIISFTNPTVGNLTAAAATAALPYWFLTFRF